MTQEPPRWPFERDEADPLAAPPKYAVRRQSCPVGPVKMWNDEIAVLATRHEDVVAITKSKVFSSDPRKGAMPAPTEAGLRFQKEKRLIDKIDDPQHAAERGAVFKEFTLTKIRTYRPFVEDMVDRILDELETADGPVDLVEQLGCEVPALMTCELIGLPHSDVEKLKVVVAQAMGQTGDVALDYAEGGLNQILTYLDEVIDAVVDAPRDDFASRLVHNYMLTGKMDRERTRRMLATIIIGGFDTTSNMISLGIAMLLDNPEQLAKVKADPALWSNTIEELLRFLSISQYNGARIALEDTSVAGVKIDKGQGVLASFVAANWDPEAFPNPEKLDVTRDTTGHVAFGVGVHQCIGQLVARLELEIVYRKFFERFTNAKLLSSTRGLEFANSTLVAAKHVLVDLGTTSR